MKAIKLLALAGVLALTAAFGATSAKAGFYGRHYYGGWHHASRGYWYNTYHYKPYVSYPTYCYNYAIWYAQAPRYVYYYNPYKCTYWGRYDLQTKGYSLLAEADRKGSLKDIPEKAFPAEGALPQVPDAKDPLTLAEPPDLPTADQPGDVVAPTPADKPAAPAGGAAAPATPAAPPADGGAVPAAPATPPADGGAAPVAPVTPVGGAAPAVPATPPADGGAAPLDPKPGIVAPVEPVNPAPATPVVAPVAPAGGAVPVPAGGAPVDGGFVPGFPTNCQKKFGTCPGHGYGWGYGWK